VTNLVIALAALLSSASPTPASVTTDVRIDVGNADWNNYQALPAPRGLPIAVMVGHVETILRERQCDLEGQSARHFEIRVPWIVQVQPDGRVSRIVVADMDCRPLEAYVANLVVVLAQQGQIRAQPGAEPRWYRSEFEFNLAS
jgi:hypothetical protein